MSNHNQKKSRTGGKSKSPRNKEKSFLELGQALKHEYFKEQSILSSFTNPSLAEELIEKTEKLVKEKGKNLSNSLLRNVYDKVLNAKNLVDLKLIRPQLAYLAGRTSGKEAIDIKSFLSFIDLLIKDVQEDSIDQFKKFMEMIVAYHKYHGKN